MVIGMIGDQQTGIPGLEGEDIKIKQIRHHLPNLKVVVLNPKANRLQGKPRMTGLGMIDATSY